MYSWKYYFRKSGGTKLLWQYIRARVIGMAICQFLLLGRSRKALELLRLIVEFKTYRRLRKQYIGVLEQAASENWEGLEHHVSRHVWICWWQGMEEAPPLVQRCYRSVCKHLKDWEITVVTMQNYQNYISFPPHIVKKWEAGKISLTHLSDLLRLELLIRYGGLWIDATVFCTSDNIPQSILESDLFVYQTLKPGADGHSSLLSNWFIYAHTNNRILGITRTLLYAYWEKKNVLVDYFIFHQFFTLACERCPEAFKRIPPICNSTPHILLLNLFEPYNPIFMEDLNRMTPFHKLSYKLDIGKTKKIEGTYWEWLMKNENKI